MVHGRKWHSVRKPKPRRSVAIATYSPRPTPLHMADAEPDNTLNLADRFTGRWLKDGHSWDEVQGRYALPQCQLAQAPSICLFLEIHSLPIRRSGATFQGGRRC